MSDTPQVSSEHDRRVDYVELPCTDVAATERFYSAAFGWTFTNYGDDYTAFADGRLTGGFHTGRPVQPAGGGALVILFAVDLADTERRVVDAGGTITTPPFDFPGGRRFHFADPSGNELAVWTDR